MRPPWAIASLLALGCGGNTPTQPSPTAAAPVPVKSDQWVPPTQGEHESLISVSPTLTAAVQFTGIGNQYRYSMGNEDRILKLYTESAPCLPEGSVTLSLNYDPKKFKGRAVFDVGAGQLRCLPILTADGVDARPLRPLLKSLAAYREALSNEEDVRLLSFGLGIHLRDDKGGVTFWVPVYTDRLGDTVEACVTLDGEEVCGEGFTSRRDEAEILPLTDAAVRSRLESLLSPSRPSAPSEVEP